MLHFIACLHDVCPDRKITRVIYKILDDCIGQYTDLVRQEGSHLSLDRSVKWLIQARLINRIFLSHQKHYHGENLHSLNIAMPKELYWFLPNLSEGGGIDWPVKKALRWTYQQAGTSQSRFHYPDQSNECEDNKQKQNLQNATRWAKKGDTRSWIQVSENIKQGFTAMKNCKDLRFQRDISDKSQQGILFANWIARLSTVICKDIQKYYGDEFLFSCIAQIKDVTEELVVEHIPLAIEVHSKIRNVKPDSSKALDILWRQSTDFFWYYKSESMIEFGRKIQPCIDSLIKQQGLRVTIPEEVIKIWVNDVGEYTVNQMLRELALGTEVAPGQEFIGLYFNFLKLKKVPDTPWHLVTEYEQAVNDKGLYLELNWTIEWLKACYYYRRELYSQAHPYFKAAFIAGKYTAGDRQYDLVNQYAESCAKNQDKVGFKKAIAWANYIGLKVRWLRDKPETDENLESAYLMLQSATYSLV